jgi:hypothetical protein
MRPSAEKTFMATSNPDRHWLRIVMGGLLLAATSLMPASAQDAADAEVDPAIDTDEIASLEFDSVIAPDAQAVLDRMTAAFDGLKRYAVTAHITRDEVLPFGYKLQHNESARMWVDAPTRMRMEVAGDIKNRTYVYDGAQVSMLVPDLNVYAETAAPATLGELVRVLLDAGVEMPLIDFLYHGNAGDLAEDVRVGLLVGDSVVDGVLTDHLAFRQPNVDWQLWVEKGAQALPRKLLITTRYEVGDPQYQATLDWDTKPRMDARSFTFVPPPGATRIPYKTSLVADGGDK